MKKLFLIFLIIFSLNSYSADTGVDSLKDIATDSIKTDSTARYVKGGALTGGRSKASIMRVIMQNLSQLQDAYNKRRYQKKGLYGRIEVKFAIDEFGEVIYRVVNSSTVNDTLLEKQVLQIISKLKFGAIHKPGDVTEVIYPFVFSADKSQLEVEALDLDRNKKGTRDSKKILKVIYREKRKLNKIHSTNFPHESGNLTVALTVDCNGAVLALKIIKSTLKKEYESVVLGAMKMWNFKKDTSSNENTEFVYTLSFP